MENKELQELIEVLKKQSEAIQQLAFAITQLVEAVLPAEGDEKPEAATYLDGQKVNNEG